jgi:hypothetical protein
MMLREEMLELLRTDPAFREEVRRQLLTEDLLALPERFDRLSGMVQELVGAVRELTEAQRRHSEQIQALIEAQQRHSEQIRALIEAQRRTEEEFKQLINWQRGEEGRRRGERYEREIIRRAPFLFNGGRGGSPEQPWVQQQLTEQLRPLLEQEVDTDDDPFLADLVWWKDKQVAVVEVSYLINGHDVERAAQRAETLRRTGAEVVAIVIGLDWATEDTPGKAIARQVEWKVGSTLSEGFINFRRAPAS